MKIIYLMKIINVAERKLYDPGPEYCKIRLFILHHENFTDSLLQ